MTTLSLASNDYFICYNQFGFIIVKEYDKFEAVWMKSLPRCNEIGRVGPNQKYNALEVFGKFIQGRTLEKLSTDLKTFNCSVNREGYSFLRESLRTKGTREVFKSERYLRLNDLFPWSQYEVTVPTITTVWNRDHEIGKRLANYEGSSELLDKLRQKEKELSDCKSKVTSLEAEKKEVSNCKSKVTSLEAEVSKYKKEPSDGESKLTNLEAEVSKYKREVSNCKSTVTNLEAEVSKYKKELSDGQSKVTNLEAEVSKYKKEVSKYKKEPSDGESKLTNLEAEVSKYKKEVSNCKSTVTNLEAEVRKYKKELSDGQSKVTNLEAEVSKYKKEVSNCKSKVTNLEAEVSKFKKELSDGESKVSSLETQVGKYMKELEEKNNMIEEYKKGKQAELESKQEELSICKKDSEEKKKLLEANNC